MTRQPVREAARGAAPGRRRRVGLRYVLIGLAVAAAVTAAVAPQPRVSLIAGDLAFSLSLAAIVSTVRRFRRAAA